MPKASLPIATPPCRKNDESEERTQEGGNAWLPDYPDLASLKNSARYHAYTRNFDEVVAAEKWLLPTSSPACVSSSMQRSKPCVTSPNRLASKLQRFLLRQAGATV